LPIHSEVHHVRKTETSLSLFSDGRRRDKETGQALQAELYEQIGRLNMDVEWLKKSVARCG